MAGTWLHSGDGGREWAEAVRYEMVCGGGRWYVEDLSGLRYSMGRPHKHVQHVWPPRLTPAPFFLGGYLTASGWLRCRRVDEYITASG